MNELAGRLAAVRAAAGFEPPLTPDGRWTGELIRRVVKAAAGVAGVDPETFVGNLLAALEEEAAGDEAGELAATVREVGGDPGWRAPSSFRMRGVRSPGSSWPGRTWPGSGNAADSVGGFSAPRLT